MRIGIDLGGSKIEGLVVGADGHEIARDRVVTPARSGNAEADYRSVVKAVERLVHWLVDESGAQADVPVGIGIPGAVSPETGLIKNANTVCLIGHDLAADLHALIARPVRVANDADCFAVSEATDGAGQGFGVVFGVILGTGCGGGIVVDGRPLRGPNAIAGEWGHNPLPWPRPWPGAHADGAADEETPGPECYCGKRGCIETFVSGRGLEADHERATGRRMRAEEIVAFADAQDPAAAHAMERYEHRLARALAPVINVLDPDVIVLGGGMSNADRLYRNVPALWGEWVFSDKVTTPLRRAQHGDASGVRGAAWLW